MAELEGAVSPEHVVVKSLRQHDSECTPPWQSYVLNDVSYAGLGWITWHMKSHPGLIHLFDDHTEVQVMMYNVLSSW